MRRRKAWRPKKVTVEWVDACTRVELHGTLGSMLDRAKLTRRESQGWLLRYDDDLTVIARDYDAPESDGEEPMVGDVQIMPSGWVIAVRHGRKKVQRESAAAADSGAVEGQGPSGASSNGSRDREARRAPGEAGERRVRASGAGLPDADRGTAPPEGA